MITARRLQREEVTQIWTMDRSEIIENIYYWRDERLTLVPEHYGLSGWPPGEAEKYTPILLDCFDRGGWFLGLFDNSQLVGAAVLESHWIGAEKDAIQLKFLHLSRDYRGRGLGRQLFELARQQACLRGAKRMYISATPSENTIHFYLGLGCRVTGAPDPELFDLEPEDIHLECSTGLEFQSS